MIVGGRGIRLHTRLNDVTNVSVRDRNTGNVSSVPIP